jgi:hypothetical protein
MKTINIDDIQKIGDITTITLTNRYGEKCVQDIKPGGKLIIPPGYDEAIISAKERNGDQMRFWKTTLSPIKKNKNSLSIPSEYFSL